jgi:DNA-binding NtrC family response regulator
MSARIVVLDAEPVVRTAITEILKHGGYTVESSGSIHSAIQIIKNSRPDLLLTNVYLPGMTGHQAMELFKGLYPELRVLMISGLPDADVIREWAGRDRFDTFPKPFAAHELLDKVRAMLAH